jgi:hypothetical protein
MASAVITKGPQNYFGEKRVAKVEHECSECGRIILRGEQYLFENGNWDGHFRKFNTCEDCRSVRASFFGAGFFYGCIWSDLEDHLNQCAGEVGEIHLTCLTPAARERVCNFIESFWANEEAQLEAQAEFEIEHSQNLYR